MTGLDVTYRLWEAQGLPLFEKKEGVMSDLKQTVNQMLSDDYKERLRAEYWQTKIRYDKLRDTIIRYECGKLDFVPGTPLSMLKEQAGAMWDYLYVLGKRALIEGVDL